MTANHVGSHEVSTKKCEEDSVENMNTNVKGVKV